MQLKKKIVKNYKVCKRNIVGKSTIINRGLSMADLPS